MKTNRPTGFTLVELLIVIVIIGMLVGMLLPAVNMVRENARQTVCLNNQQNVGKAIIGYDLDKKRLPWAISEVRLPSGTTVPYTWALAILPGLGRQDVWNDFAKNGVANLPKRIDVLVCPNDLLKNSRDNALSFGVNCGPPNDTGDKTTINTGQFRVKNSSITTTKVSLADLSSTNRIALFSERTTTASSQQQFTYPSSPTSVTATVLDPIGFLLKNSTYGAMEISAALPSAHPGITIMTFADGHTEKMTNSQSFNDANIQRYP